MKVKSMQSMAFLDQSSLANSYRSSIAALALLLFFLFCSESAISQEIISSSAQDASSLQTLQEHLLAGEFSVAESLIDRLPEEHKGQGRVLLFQSQSVSGAGKGAMLTVGKIEDDSVRNKQMSWLRGQINGMTSDSTSAYGKNDSSKNFSGNSNSPLGPANGAGGGISEADFTPLIDLITSTIAPNTWSTTGGAASIRSFPSGVFVDSTGTLKRIQVDASKSRTGRLSVGNLANDTSDWFQDSGNRQVQFHSKLRKVSLTRLERITQTRYSMGVPFDDSIRNLAGLTRIDYVFFDPKRGEIIIAGPAGGWEKDVLGRPISTQDRKPVMQLDDFVVCHRNARNAGGKFGCTIDPRAESLQAAQELIQKGIKNQSQRDKLRAALGKQDITVFGIDPRTNAGRVLVESDHHMKLVGMGLAPSIPQVPCYFDRLELKQMQEETSNEVIRWWFTIRDADLICDEAMEFFDISQVNVKVLSESEMLSEQGERIHTGQSTAPTQGFARDFTRNFEAMSIQYPVYQELKNIFSLAVVANLVRSQKFEDRGGRSLDFFDSSGTSNGFFAYPERLSPAPTQVDSVLNYKVISERKPQSTVQTTVLGVSGGVEVDGTSAVSNEKIKTSSEMSDLKKKEIDRELSPIWWWD